MAFWCLVYVICASKRRRERRETEEKTDHKIHMYIHNGPTKYIMTMCVYLSQCIELTDKQSTIKQVENEKAIEQTARDRKAHKKYRIQTHTTVGKNRREIAPIYHSMSLGEWK